MDPAKHKAGKLVVQHGRDLFSGKFALEPAGSWELDQLPEKSKLRERQVLGMRVSLLDVPVGRHLVVPVGKSKTSPTLFWMCPCGTRYIQHKEHWSKSVYVFNFLLPPSYLLLLLVSGSSSTSTSTAVL